MKKYQPTSVKSIIDILKSTVEDHTRKQVQMHARRRQEHHTEIFIENTHPFTTLFILQKNLRIITFSSSMNIQVSPLFKNLNVVKLFDIITFQLAVFMYKFPKNLLPSVFDPYFNSVWMLHNYNTRLSSKMTYVIPQVRTHYGTFNIRFQGAKVWNYISDDIKLLPLKIFKKDLKLFLLEKYY